MSSLLENHLINLALTPQANIRRNPCWKLLNCTKVLCPIHGKSDIDCWLEPRTHCTTHLTEDYFEKLAGCLACSYFKARGTNFFKGWNHFVSDQLHRYNVKALERIYQKEESFIEILNRIPDGLFTTDQEWRITYFNPAAEKITGFSAYDAVGMYCKDVFKNPICEYDCALKRAVAEGKDIHNREYLIKNIAGQKIPIICSTSAFYDSTGKITGGLEIFKDTSELKRLQEEVIKRERKFRRIFEGSHDMIYSTNYPGKILDINPAGIELLGFQNKDELLEALSAQDLYFNSDDRHRFLQTINAEGFVKDFEVDFKNRNGSPLHVLISSRRYENPKTGEVEYEGIIKDITRRKQAEVEIKERNRELSILNTIAVALNHTMDLKQILQFTLRDVLKILRLKSGALFLIDREEKKAVLAVKHNLPDMADDQADPISFKDEMLKKYLIEETVSFTPKPTFPVFQMRYTSKNGQQVPWLACFLITFKGRGVGFFALQKPASQDLNQRELHLLGSLGNFLGGAIENTRLLDTIQQHRQELRQLTEKLFQSQEEERRRIARELHDEAGQSLTAVKLSLDHLEEKIESADSDLKTDISEIRKMVKRTSSEIRRLSYHLHPTLLIDLGLEPALNLYFNEIEKHSGLSIEFHMVGFDGRISPDIETVLYRFSQETLTNVLKHAGAETFRLSIIKSYPMIIFSAEDDGFGFDDQIIGKDKQSLGLLGMRERASLLGGTFNLRSTPKFGTRIRIEIPFADESSHETIH